MRIDQRDSWRVAVPWLVDAVRQVSNVGEVGRHLPLPNGVPQQELADAADFHGVPGFARLAAPVRVPALETAVHAAQSRHLRAVGDLETVSTALDEAGIGFLIAKGPSLVETSYSGADLRSYVDLDVLVRPAYLGPAVHALEARGCTLVDANWPFLAAHRVHELRLEGPGGGAIDLHWSLSAGAGELFTAPPAATLLARSTLVGDRPRFRVLSPPDLTVHVAVHAAASGGHRLIWMTDMRGAIEYATRHVSTARILGVADEWGARPALSLMARRASRILEAELPRDLVSAIRPGLWTAAVAAAEHLSPPERAGLGSSASRLVARACRRTPQASMVAAGRKSASWVRQGGPTPPGPEVINDVANPSSALYPSGGRRAAERFFAEVAKGDLG